MKDSTKEMWAELEAAIGEQKECESFLKYAEPKREEREEARAFLSAVKDEVRERRETLQAALLSRGYRISLKKG